MIKLSDLLKLSEVSPVRVAGDASFKSIVADSRGEVRHSLFVCMPSAATDTHQFLAGVALAGASAAIVHSDAGWAKCAEIGLPCIQLSSDLTEFNQALGLMCREFHSDPTLDVRVFGITGTNGKTTCAWMLRQALRALGREAAYLGTLGYQGAGELEELPNTTPFPVELWALLARARREGITDLVMEVSSHALDQARVAGVRFDVGLFTNLSQDHLDYHKSMEAYARAKRMLFEEYAQEAGDPFVAVINADDPVGRQWAAEWAQRLDEGVEEFAPFTLTYGFENGTVRGEAKAVDFDQINLGVTAISGSAEVSVGVGGSFNLQNALTVYATLMALGVSPHDAAEAMTHVTPVPGRFEAVSNAKGIGVIVDYAHTDDALQKLLESALELEPKKLICVFGCGGDRDRTKRPKMAKVATSLADHTVITSDNPRTEDPAQILQDIVAGAAGSFEVVEDRSAAIAAAIRQAERGDLVVIAGKGHETYQILGRTKTPFDDREHARIALGERV